jgi:hypothetical protein
VAQLRTLLQDQGLAAWVQAIGSIVAIVVAFWIAYSEGRQTKKREEARTASEEADRLRRAQALALMIMPELAALEGTLDRLWDRLWAHVDTDHLSFQAVTVPKTILEVADQLYLLGGAGGSILQMIGTLNADAALITANRDVEGMLTIGHVAQAEFERLRKERLNIARKNCADAVRELRRIVESPARPH